MRLWGSSCSTGLELYRRRAQPMRLLSIESKRKAAPKRERPDEGSVREASHDNNPAPKRARATFTLRGGTAQPPRVIGYRRTGANVDVTLSVEGRRFSAHSKVLAACSGLFARLVANGSAFSKQPHALPGTAVAVEAVLEFFYTGECVIGEADLVPLLEQAHRLQADVVMRAAVEAVTSRLSPATCLDALGLAGRLQLAPLKVAAEGMVRPHFEQVRTHPSFGELPEAFVSALLADDALGITQEESAFEAATAWISAQKPALTAERIARMLSLVRFPTLPRAYVTDVVLHHPVITSHPRGSSLVLETYLDAHYGPPTAQCRPRHGVQPLTFTTGCAPPVGAGSPSKPRRRSSRSRSRSRDAGQRVTHDRI